MPSRRWRSPRALAAQVSYGCPPETSVFSNSSGFNQSQVHCRKIFSDIVQPFLSRSSSCTRSLSSPNNAICGNLSAVIRDTWQKYVSHRIRRSSLISLSIYTVFIMSTFRFLSRRVTPRIFLKTDISKTFNFCLCSFRRPCLRSVYHSRIRGIT